jgi:hypothetical protein
MVASAKRIASWILKHFTQVAIITQSMGAGRQSYDFSQDEGNQQNQGKFLQCILPQEIMVVPIVSL